MALMTVQIRLHIIGGMNQMIILTAIAVVAAGGYYVGVSLQIWRLRARRDNKAEIRDKR